MRAAGEGLNPRDAVSGGSAVGGGTRVSPGRATVTVQRLSCTESGVTRVLEPPPPPGVPLCAPTSLFDTHTRAGSPSFLPGRELQEKESRRHGRRVGELPGPGRLSWGPRAE